MSGDTEDLYTSITYIGNIKSTKDRVVTYIWQPARELCLAIVSPKGENFHFGLK